jgi:hypothetical protein
MERYQVVIWSHTLFYYFTIVYPLLSLIPHRLLLSSLKGKIQNRLTMLGSQKSSLLSTSEADELNTYTLVSPQTYRSLYYPQSQDQVHKSSNINRYSLINNTPNLTTLILFSSTTTTTSIPTTPYN